jgi:hypothetical protein
MNLGKYPILWHRFFTDIVKNQRKRSRLENARFLLANVKYYSGLKVLVKAE